MLAEIAAVPAEAAESVVRAVEMVRQTQPTEWINQKQAARSLGRVLTPLRKLWRDARFRGTTLPSGISY